MFIFCDFCLLVWSLVDYLVHHVRVVAIVQIGLLLIFTCLGDFAFYRDVLGFVADVVIGADWLIVLIMHVIINASIVLLPSEVILDFTVQTRRYRSIIDNLVRLFLCNGILLNFLLLQSD